MSIAFASWDIICDINNTVFFTRGRYATSHPPYIERSGRAVPLLLSSPLPRLPPLLPPVLSSLSPSPVPSSFAASSPRLAPRVLCLACRSCPRSPWRRRGWSFLPSLRPRTASTVTSSPDPCGVRNVWAPSPRCVSPVKGADAWAASPHSSSSVLPTRARSVRAPGWCPAPLAVVPGCGTHTCIR